jgi:hypothetical protein
VKYEWTEERIVAKGNEFINSVIRNMGSHASSVVRFGTEGNGNMPNYQVEKTLDLFGQEKKIIELYQSRSHNQLKTLVDGFNPDNLSCPFSLREMEALKKLV